MPRHSNSDSPPVKSVEISAARRYVLRARNTSNTFTFCRSFVSHLRLSKITALFLQDLINRASLISVERKEINGKEFFLCTEEFLKLSMDWAGPDQRRKLTELKKRKYVEVATKGNANNRRWIHINILKIEEDIDEVEFHNAQIDRTVTFNLIDKEAPSKEGCSKSIRDVRKTAHPTEGDEMKKGYFDTGESSVHYQIAERLRRLATDVRRYRIYGRMVTWEREVKSLVNWTYKGDLDRVMKILGFYEENVAKKDYKPVISSHKSIKRCFPWIEEQMEDHLRKNPEVLITDDARILADRFRTWGWPKGGAEDLPSFVQLALDRVGEFRTNLNHLALEGSTGRFLTYLLKGGLPSTKHIAEEYTRHTHSWAKRSNKWSGKLLPHALTTDGEWFTTFGRRLATGFNRRPSTWDDLVEEIKKCGSKDTTVGKRGNS